jgi:hypothetical protein
MVETKFLVEVVVVVVTLAVAIYLLYTNYGTISDQLGDFFKGVPFFSRGG